MSGNLRRIIQTATHDDRWGIAAVLAGAGVLAAAMAPFQDEIGLLNEGLAFLVLTLLIAATWGWRVGLFAAVLTSLALNFFFVPPLHTFTVDRPSDFVGLVLFLVVSLVAGSLLTRARTAAESSRRRQAETEVLLDLSRDLIGRADPTDALTTLCANVVRAFAAPGAGVLSPTDSGLAVLAFAGDDNARLPPDATDAQLARQALASGSIAARGYLALGEARRPRIALPRRGVVDVPGGVAFVPLKIGDRALGVLRLHGPIENRLFRERPEELLTAFAREAALGVQRVELAQEAAHAEALRQAGEMKTALLTSVSHDLKTPLAGIKTAVSSLLDQSVSWSSADARSFLETIDTQTDRLDRFISDILDLNRIESGAVPSVARRLHARDLFEEAVERTAQSTRGRSIRIHAGPDLMVVSDESLILQALVNLIENAAAYSTPGGAIRLGAERVAGRVELSIADEGPGIARDDLPHVFERFYRAREWRGRSSGSGLGLAIVRAFVGIASGTVSVESSSRGTRFAILLPAAGAASDVA